MNKLTFDDVRNKNLLLYEYIRGSQAYGLATPESDVDTGGCYIAPVEHLIDLGYSYQEQIQDDKHDNVWYELNKMMRLLLTSNPTMLESLFVPESCVLYEHPIMTEIKKHRDLFVTKKCFKSFGGYAKSQIEKARGLNKKIVNPVYERKEVLDFCYTFKGQGSQSMKDFLKDNCLDQKYCGLVNIPNMKDTYGVYYDFAAYLHFENVDLPTKRWLMFNSGLVDSNTIDKIFKRIDDKEFFGYDGIVHPDGKSNEVRLSSIPKGEVPICFMTYNKDGYTSHCIRYKEYKEWEEKRNPVRYQSNLNKNYDAKNMMHCFRLIQMCIEIANGEGFNLDRTNIDREFLLKIKTHGFEYDELMEILDKKVVEMNEAIAKSTIPDDIDVKFVNDLLLKIRTKQIRENHDLF